MLFLIKKLLKVCSEQAYRIIFLFYSLEYIRLEFIMVLQRCYPWPTSSKVEKVLYFEKKEE